MARLKKRERELGPPGEAAAEADPLARLYEAVVAQARNPGIGSRTARLLAAGLPKIAQKVVEEAAEVAIDAVRGQRQSLVHETADLFYNLVVLLVKQEIPLDAIWAEMTRRERLHGIAEKLPKPPAPEDLD